MPLTGTDLNFDYGANSGQKAYLQSIFSLYPEKEPILNWWWAPWMEVIRSSEQQDSLGMKPLSQQNPLTWAVWFLDLCCKRDCPAIISTPETRSCFFIPLHLAGPHWCCTATHVCRNIYYPSSFTVTVFFLPSYYFAFTTWGVWDLAEAHCSMRMSAL